MPREKEGFREQLQSLQERFPGQEAIPIKEAAAVIGVHARTLASDKSFPKKKVGSGGKSPWLVPLIQFARWLS